MEGNVVLSYLRSKFSSTLKEAAKDEKISSQMLARFQSIEKHINDLNQNSGALIDPLYDLMDALSECTIFANTEAASKKGFNLFRLLTFENNMRSRLDKIDKTLTDTDPEATAGAGPSGLVIQKAYPPDPSLITGFESEVSEIEKLLMPMDSEGNGFKPIGIVGMCGCGKTTLAQKVFASRKAERIFFPRIWVSLSERLIDKERSDLRVGILNHILREIGHDASDLEYGNYSVVKLLEKLRLRLKGKRYLIVLDDAWQMDKWFSDLGCCTGQPEAEWFTHGLPKDSGGAVIVTSRGEDVIRRMVGEKHVIRPRLSEDACWNIFNDAVRQQGKIKADHPKLIQMEKSVKDNCQGLPLAAKTLACVISNLLLQ